MNSRLTRIHRIASNSNPFGWNPHGHGARHVLPQRSRRYQHRIPLHRPHRLFGGLLQYAEGDAPQVALRGLEAALWDDAAHQRAANKCRRTGEEIQRAFPDPEKAPEAVERFNREVSRYNELMKR